MSVLATAILAAEEGGHVVNELPIAPLAVGIIVFAIFVVLGIATFSFRDVANRHAAKAEAYAREHGENPAQH